METKGDKTIPKTAIKIKHHNEIFIIKRYRNCIFSLFRQFFEKRRQTKKMQEWKQDIVIHIRTYTTYRIKLLA